MDTVKKWVSTSSHGGMVAVVTNDPGSTYVEWSDYATLLDRAEKAEAELAALRARIAGLATKCANAVDANFEYMADTLDDVSVSLLRLLPAEGDTTTDGGQDG